MIKCFLINIFTMPLLISLAGCDNQMQKLSDGNEVSSQVAPDRFSRAFVWTAETDGLGATISQPYQVWMQSLQGKSQETLILESDKTDGLKLAWAGVDMLEICYAQAQITYFRNFFVVAEQNSSQIYKVEIILKKVKNFNDC